MAVGFSAHPDRFAVRVVVAFRDEEPNLHGLLMALSRQTCSDFELVLVDDHSSDNGWTLARQFASSFRHFILLRSAGVGKKAALLTGISFVSPYSRSFSDTLIMTTDADCLMSGGWVEAVSRSFRTSDTRLLLGPVRLRGSSFLSLEWMSLQAVTRLTAWLRVPVLCNGANMAFFRSDFMCLQGSSDIPGARCASGDDVFLLQAFRRRGLSVAYLDSPQGLVDTLAPCGLASFFRQRFRWVRKVRDFHDPVSLLMAFFVFCLCLLMVVLPLFSLRCYVWTILLLLLVELPLFFSQARRFNQWGSLLWLPVWQVLYPFYVLISLVGGWASAPLWKGRVLRNG